MSTQPVHRETLNNGTITSALCPVLPHMPDDVTRMCSAALASGVTYHLDTPSFWDRHAEYMSTREVKGRGDEDQ